MDDVHFRKIDKVLSLESDLYDKELLDNNTVNLWSNPHHWNYPIIKRPDMKTLEESQELQQETIYDIVVPYQSLYLTISILHHHHIDLPQIRDICLKHGFEFGHSFIFLNDTPNDIIHLKNKMVILLVDKKINK